MVEQVNQEATPSGGKNRGIGRIVGGAIAVVVPAIFLFAPTITNSHGYSLSIWQQNGLCSSSMGQLAQAINGTAQSDCSQSGLAFGVSLLVIVVGLGLVGWGIYALVRSRSVATAAS